VTIILFDATVADDGEPGREKNGFFEVMVPVPPAREIVSLRVTNAEGWREYAAIERSAPPEIVITAPQPGVRLDEQTEVGWVVRDPDTPEERLLYQLAYSPDAGRNWVPIAVDVPGTARSIVFDSTEIQRSDGNGVIRVFVSDGLNTAFADVGGLTTVAARYPTP
jgi:hypothetical protein